MDIAKLTLAGVLTGATASAAAFTGDGSNYYALHSVPYYMGFTLCLMGLPVLYIIFRSGVAVGTRLMWLSVLLAVHIGSLVVMPLSFASFSSYALLTPAPYVMSLLPGYILVNCYKACMDAKALPGVDIVS